MGERYEQEFSLIVVWVLNHMSEYLFKIWQTTITDKYKIPDNNNKMKKKVSSLGR